MEAKPYATSQAANGIAAATIAARIMRRAARCFRLRRGAMMGSRMGFITTQGKHGFPALAINILACFEIFFVHTSGMPKKPIAGTYKLTTGSVFYIGSTANLAKRRSQHAYDLKKGIHPCHKLQSAYTGEVSCLLIDRIPRKSGETDTEHRERLRAAEQVLIDRLWGQPGLANRSRNSRGPDNRELMRTLWQNPEYRARWVKQIRSRPPVSDETRKRMAAAKRGARNAKARPVLVTWPDGRQQRFDTATDAAAAIGVSQQLCQMWLAGKVRQPEEGRLKRAHAHLCGLRVNYLVETESQ